jgi:hypothetical protein
MVKKIKHQRKRRGKLTKRNETISKNRGKKNIKMIRKGKRKGRDGIKTEEGEGMGEVEREREDEEGRVEVK